MIDWLKRGRGQEMTIALGERRLPIVIRRLAHARRLTLRLSPDGNEVRLAMPSWGQTAEALAFARSRSVWLARQLDEMPVAEAVAPGTRIAYRGAQLTVEHSPAAARAPWLDGEAIHTGGPAETLAGRLRRWLEREARSLIAEDLAHYCTCAGRPVPKLALSSARRRWGSCAGSGTVRINWRLVMAPDFVRRSVVAHEVAHLVHFDHSTEFHALLGEIYEGDIKEANRWLRCEGRGLYARFG